jgi:dihydroxyacetone kinase-like protein
VTDRAVTTDQLAQWVRAFAALVADNSAYLTELDSAIGDADHGINMDRGMRAVIEKLGDTPPATADELFKLVGLTLVGSVGGASGPLYGTFFLRFGAAAGAAAELSPDIVAQSFRAGLEGLAARGKPELGDKTMFDALHPALQALDDAIASGAGVHAAFEAAAAAGAAGRDATIPMVARKGRASYLGERSAGHQDPGATSAVLLLQAAVAALPS